MNEQAVDTEITKVHEEKLIKVSPGPNLTHGLAPTDCQVTYLAQPIPFFVIFGECGIAYVNIVQELSSQHMKQTGREERDVRMQFRLACQMLASMFGTILMNLATTLGQFYVQTNFHFFILFTFSWQALCCMNCLIYIIFQREKKRLPQGARSTITVHSEIHSHHRQTRKNQISNQK
ncbi:unnamed protein product, partial [Mesorhabditis belari]|uniref:Uncharacterized protein n=1 Tax=Mesorhabditis belari TaxID=2138241 RepID=A0AAF3F192_9BILA